MIFNFNEPIKYIFLILNINKNITQKIYLFKLHELRNLYFEAYKIWRPKIIVSPAQCQSCPR